MCGCIDLCAQVCMFVDVLIFALKSVCLSIVLAQVNTKAKSLEVTLEMSTSNIRSLCSFAFPEFSNSICNVCIE